MSDALVAQLDRASDYGSEGCAFEPRRVRQFRKDFSLGLKSFFLSLIGGIRTKVLLAPKRIVIR